MAVILCSPALAQPDALLSDADLSKGHRNPVTRQITPPFGRPRGSSDRTNQVRLAAQHSREGVPICGWVGVEVRPMTRPFADSLGMTEPYGAIFDQPQPNSPAAQANIEAGDVVTAVNGSPLGSWSDFIPTISAMAPGTDVYLTTYRDQQLASSRDRVGDFPTNFDELSAGFSCCRCEHVGNALALSIMSTAWPRMRDGSVGEALPCALVIWIAQVQARLRRRYSIGDIIGPSDLNSPTRFHEDPTIDRGQGDYRLFRMPPSLKVCVHPAVVVVVT